MPHRETAIGRPAQPRGDLVRPGLRDNSSWEQILAILVEKSVDDKANEGKD
jgi:hypothetical protein